MSLPSFFSAHFEIATLSDGIHAVVGDLNGLCHSNAGILDLGERSLVVDTLTLPTYADDLAAACRALTGRDPSWIAFTHYHADHLLGNQSFPATVPLLATPAMRAPTDEWMKQYQAAIDDPDGFQKDVDEFEASMTAEESPLKQAAMRTNLLRHRALQGELPRLRLVRPNTFFEGVLTLSGTKRRVDLVEVLGAHTASDVTVRAPEDGVLFMGDLGFFDTIPFIAYGDPLRWIDVLREFEDSGYETFVPGHGAVGGKDKVRAQRECMEAIVEVVRAALDAGEAITDAVSKRLPEPFRAWASRGRFNEMNYQSIAKSISSAS
jgi:cyclase